MNAKQYRQQRDVARSLMELHRMRADRIEQCIQMLQTHDEAPLASDREVINAVLHHWEVTNGQSR